MAATLAALRIVAVLLLYASSLFAMSLCLPKTLLHVRR
jgi:hypothetical protein